MRDTKIVERILQRPRRPFTVKKKWSGCTLCLLGSIVGGGGQRSWIGCDREVQWLGPKVACVAKEQRPHQEMSKHGAFLIHHSCEAQGRLFKLMLSILFGLGKAVLWTNTYKQLMAGKHPWSFWTPQQKTECPGGKGHFLWGHNCEWSLMQLTHLPLLRALVAPVCGLYPRILNFLSLRTKESPFIWPRCILSTWWGSKMMSVNRMNRNLVNCTPCSYLGEPGAVWCTHACTNTRWAFQSPCHPAPFYPCVSLLTYPIIWMCQSIEEKSLGVDCRK